MTLLAHAVRRGLEYYSSTSSLVKRDNQQDEIAKAFMSVGGAVIFVTFILFLAVLVAVDYSISNVVTTLAMIETPTSAITVTPASDDDIALKSSDAEAKEGLLEAGTTGPNITLVAQQPITAKIRGTLRHLRATAGRAAPFRGYANHWVYQTAFVFVASLVQQLLPRFPGVLILVSAITGALLAQVHVAWTHKVVAMPTNSRFWQRMVSVSDWKALALPAAIQASATYVSIYIVQGMIFLFGIDSPNQKTIETTGQAWCAIFKGVSILAIAAACGLFFCLPAMVTLIRVESSILPEDQETIIPFDRTFEGKVIPRIHGGSGRVSFVDAWKSFNWEARRRIIKLYFKTMAIGTAIAFIFVQVLVLEIWAFMGPAFFAHMAAQERQRTGAY